MQLSDADMPRDYGAPTGLAMQAKRTLEQQALVTHVRELQRQALALVVQLESTPHIDRQGIIIGRAFLRAGCMSLVNAIMRSEEEL